MNMSSSFTKISDSQIDGLCKVAITKLLKNENENKYKGKLTIMVDNVSSIKIKKLCICYEKVSIYLFIYRAFIICTRGAEKFLV